jgi:DNA-binding NarL/FixJ family response regulator
MEDKTKEFDGVIRIETGQPEDDLNYVEKLLKELPPKERKWAVKYYMASFKLGMYRIQETLAKMIDTIWQARMDIPSATRQREPILRKLLARGYTSKQIASEMNWSKRTVDYDLKSLGIQRYKHRK